jgi:hypothetical protein
VIVTGSTHLDNYILNSFETAGQCQCDGRVVADIERKHGENRHSLEIIVLPTSVIRRVDILTEWYVIVKCNYCFVGTLSGNSPLRSIKYKCA